MDLWFWWISWEAKFRPIPYVDMNDEPVVLSELKMQFLKNSFSLGFGGEEL